MIPDCIDILSLTESLACDFFSAVRNGNDAFEAFLDLPGLPFPYHGNCVAYSDAVNMLVPVYHFQQEHDDLSCKLLLLFRAGDNKMIVSECNAHIAFLFNQRDILIIQSE